LILSLDTNVMVDIINDRTDHVRNRYRAAQASGDKLVTCAIAAYELIYGAVISPRPQVHLPNAEELLEQLDVEPWTLEDGYAASRLRFSLRKVGRMIGSADILIAGQALSRHWTVVSSNLRHFERVEGLQVIDWREAPSEG
jgi:tRNA(fMet)-specific endonuclease VapC